VNSQRSSPVIKKLRRSAYFWGNAWVGQVYEKRVLNPAAFGVKASGNSLGRWRLERLQRLDRMTSLGSSVRHVCL
jgi:hypothetical protein